jgi:hypothetical protein
VPRFPPLHSENGELVGSSDTSSAICQLFDSIQSLLRVTYEEPKENTTMSVARFLQDIRRCHTGTIGSKRSSMSWERLRA